MQAPEHLTERYRAMLHELAELTLAMARQLVALAARDAEAAHSAIPPTTPRISPQDYALALDRVARATRRTITLARHLDQPLPAPNDPAISPAHARKRIIRSVEDEILRCVAEPGEATILRTELLERLDAPEFADDLSGHQPIPDIIRDICRDLGLDQSDDVPWPRRTPGDLHALLLQARSPTPDPDAPLPLFTATWSINRPKRRKHHPAYTPAQLALMDNETLDALADDEDDPPPTQT